MNASPAPHLRNQPRAGIGSRGWIAVGIAVVATAAVVAALWFALDGPRMQRTEIARLAAAPSLAWPEALVPRPEHSVRHDDFLGLVIVSTGWDLDASAVSCLYVSRDGSQSLESFERSCGSGSLRPTVQVVVGPQSPPELSARYAAGQTLRFVLDEREVKVVTAP